MINRWSHANGYRQVLAISLPMVASMGTMTIMMFTDRMFLTHYSVDAISASLPAGFASFTFISFFMGVANYTNTFVAQYTGAGTTQKVGAALWQGIYFSLFSAMVLALFIFISKPMFSLIGHSHHIQTLEVSYFNILMIGAGLTVLSSTLACFYTGRGLTWTVMVVNICGAVVNIPLDYCLINGMGIFPELGIKGAALATVSSSLFICMLYLFLIFNSSNRKTFGMWSKRAFDTKLFSRLMHFGMPSGVQFFLEIFGFTVFIQMIGRIGDVELAVSNIVLSLEMVAFLPMVGFHIGTATLVGQSIGAGKPEDGVYATISSLHLTYVYMACIVFVFIFTPEPVLRLFQSDNYTPEAFSQIIDLGVILLRFVVVFCLFDACNLVFSGAIKGAGDTKFIMWATAVISITTMIVPIYIAIEVLHAGIYTAWVLVTLYASALGIVFMLRFLQGKWKSMKVIEDPLVISKTNKSDSEQKGDYASHLLVEQD